MNDLNLLRTHGPEGTDLDPTVQAAARAALLQEVFATATSSEMAADSRILARPRWGVRRIATLGAVAAAVAGLAVLAPSWVSPAENGAVALGPATPPNFPFTLTALPSSLGEPVFEQSAEFFAARYGSVLDGVGVLTDVHDPEHWDIPADALTADVNGHSAQIIAGTANDGTAASAEFVTIIWRSTDHGWTAVRGSGSFADARQVEKLAESLVQQPQPADLAIELGVAPEGWQLAAYKDDAVMTLSRDGSLSPDVLTVALSDGAPESLAQEPGLRDLEEVTVNDMPGYVARRTADGGQAWILTARTTEGQGFSVQALASSLTRDQVIEVARGVRYAP